MPDRRFRLVNIAHSDRFTAVFSTSLPSGRRSKFDVVSVNELASMFEGGGVVRGDELM
jgi:hypothetical protein